MAYERADPARERSSAAALPLEIRLTVDGSRHELELSGDLDLDSAGELERELRRIQETAAESITVDLGAVRWIDSIGLRVLVHAHHRARSTGCRLELRPGPPNIQRVFELTGLDSRLTFVERRTGTEA